MAESMLDRFGAILMEKVRDEAISDWTTLLDGRMKGELPAKANQLLRSFRSLPADSKKIMIGLIPGIVDTVLHHLLWIAEQQRELQLGIDTGHGVENLRDVSDGLPGELYSDEGWIARFSKNDRFL